MKCVNANTKSSYTESPLENSYLLSWQLYGIVIIHSLFTNNPLLVACNQPVVNPHKCYSDKIPYNKSFI